LPINNPDKTVLDINALPLNRVGFEFNDDGYDKGNISMGNHTEEYLQINNVITGDLLKWVIKNDKISSDANVSTNFINIIIYIYIFFTVSYVYML
jgi:hypothetical protein